VAPASAANRGSPAALLPYDLGQALSRLHAQISSCRRCVEAGQLDRAFPILPAPVGAAIVLVGQAPGRVEEVAGRPFSGRAGRLLFRWLATAGLGDEESARRTIYLTSITKCFPGAAPSGSGDRRPSSLEVRLCRDHLDLQLGLVRPWLVLTVGQMALERFLGPLPMHLAVGQVFGSDGTRCDPGTARAAGLRPLLLPLPHPSGASRWLNAPDHRALLERALGALRELCRAGSDS